MLLVEAMAKAVTDKNFKFIYNPKIQDKGRCPWLSIQYVKYDRNSRRFLYEDGKIFMASNTELINDGYEEYEKTIKYFGIEEAIKYLKQGRDVYTNLRRTKILKLDDGKAWLKDLDVDKWWHPIGYFFSAEQMYNNNFSLCE